MIGLLPNYLRDIVYIVTSLVVTIAAAGVLYVVLFYLLRSLFRRFERDIALVTLNVSAYPALSLFVLTCLKVTSQNSNTLRSVEWLHRLLIGCIILAACYWFLRLFKQVLVYYLKEYAETTEAMWDQVLIPLLEGIIPMITIVVSGSAILQLCFGLDLTGAWITLGGGAFVIGFAVKDILANFFSGIVLLLDSPFQFGDVLQIEGESGGPRHLGILKQIGVRVTNIYLFESHTEVYIPNSVMQTHKITNFSRPIEPVYFSTHIELNPNCDLDRAQKVMKEVIQAHPDTIGDIETKLACLKDYYDWDGATESFQEKKDNGQQRLLAESAVNKSLEDIEQALEALILTLGFLEKGGLSQDEINTIQQEYDYVLELIGIAIIQPNPSHTSSFLTVQRGQVSFEIEEISNPNSLINRVREWYRAWLRDPNVVHKDEYVLQEVWERKINLLSKRASKLYQKILHPVREETRLDDYVKELVLWLRNRFKQARSEWHEPHVRMKQVIHREGYTYLEFSLNYYVDDIRLEDGERGMRINSDIHREIMRHLKKDCQSPDRLPASSKQNSQHLSPC